MSFSDISTILMAILVVIPIVILFIYIATRLISFGVFNSWFQAKRNHESIFKKIKKGRTDDKK